MNACFVPFVCMRFVALEDSASFCRGMGYEVLTEENQEETTTDPQQRKRRCFDGQCSRFRAAYCASGFTAWPVKALSRGLGFRVCVSMMSLRHPNGFVRSCPEARHLQ